MIVACYLEPSPFVVGPLLLRADLDGSNEKCFTNQSTGEMQKQNKASELSFFMVDRPTNSLG